MSTPRTAGDTGTTPPGTRRPLLAGGLLVGGGLVDVIAAWADTGTDPFMVATREGVHQVDITGWAWLHLAVGAAVVVAGLLVLTGRRGAVLVGIGCATLAIAVNLLILPYAPLRAALVIALNGAAVRLLLRHLRARPPG